MENIYAKRIGALRRLMEDKGWNAVVLRGSDPHCSEYLAPRYQVVTWLSGFTGEAGDIVVTADHAGLWTDSRYFIQAAAQLQGTGVELHKTRLPESVDIPQWLALQLRNCGLSSPQLSEYAFPHPAQTGERPYSIACDSLCESSSSMAAIVEACSASSASGAYGDNMPLPDGCCGFRLEMVPDLIDAIWEDRPAVPCTPIITLDESTVGMTRLEKIEWLRSTLGSFDYRLVTALDEIAWMLNVRGEDIDYNPVVFSYLLVGRDCVRWFCRPEGYRLGFAGEDVPQPDEDTLDSFDTLEKDGISIEAYENIAGELEQIVGRGESIAYDPDTTNACLSSILAGGASSSPIPLKKSVKTSVEIDGMREAHLEDGLAMEKYLYWLECRLKEGPVSEWDAALKLHEFRAEIPGFQGESFETISAWGPGGALPHYATPQDGSTLIRPYGLYLCDSGGQYLFGTTDITRTVPCGETTQQEREDYTIVLKGMIDLTMAVFPYGTAGCQIDALAREPLWRAGRNFGHGTGHGVGFFLCVHEGPQSIRQNFLSQPLLPGMITSNEPAVYREGQHGIRHENLILCKELFSNEFGRFLGFETLSCCHFDTSALLPDLLSQEEKAWLNSYNEKVYRNFAPAIEDEDFLRWLRAKTLPIE